MEIRDSELRFHLINVLPENIAFQFKLLPKLEYGETIPKVREVLLIPQLTDNPINQVDRREERLERHKETIIQVSR